MWFFKGKNEQINLPDSNGQRYEAALQLLAYEGQISWQMNILFIGLNVGICTVIQDYIGKITDYYGLVGLFSIAGIIINIAWLGTFRRNNRYYHFRMAQAREAEPEGWNLLKNRGYRFSKGHEVIVDDGRLESQDKLHQLSSFERLASNKTAIGIAIWIFIIGFSILFALSSIRFTQPKSNCNCERKSISINVNTN